MCHTIRMRTPTHPPTEREIPTSNITNYSRCTLIVWIITIWAWEWRARRSTKSRAFMNAIYTPVFISTWNESAVMYTIICTRHRANPARFGWKDTPCAPAGVCIIPVGYGGWIFFCPKAERPYRAPRRTKNIVVVISATVILRYVLPYWAALCSHILIPGPAVAPTLAWVYMQAIMNAT